MRLSVNQLWQAIELTYELTAVGWKLDAASRVENIERLCAGFSFCFDTAPLSSNLTHFLVFLLLAFSPSAFQLSSCIFALLAEFLQHPSSTS
jgi:hypothetical protein